MGSQETSGGGHARFGDAGGSDFGLCAGQRWRQNGPHRLVRAHQESPVCTLVALLSAGVAMGMSEGGRWVSRGVDRMGKAEAGLGTVDSRESTGAKRLRVVAQTVGGGAHLLVAEPLSSAHQRL